MGMAKEPKEFLQIWLSWILGTVAGSLISAVFLDAVALEAFLLCALIGVFLLRRLVERREPRPVLV